MNNDGLVGIVYCLTNKVNGKMYMTLNTGHKWKVSPSVFKMISSSQPLQQEEQGGPSGLSRIAHLAGIR